MLKKAISIVAFLLLVAAFTAAHAAETDGPPRIRGRQITVCACTRFCEAALGGSGSCAHVVALEIESGAFGSIDLDGRQAVVIFSPASGDQQKSTAVVFVDEKSSTQQAEAVRGMVETYLGGDGAPYTFVPPQRAPMKIETEHKQLRVWVEGVCDVKGSGLPGRSQRTVMLQNLLRTIVPTQFLGRGEHGQVDEPLTRVRFQAGERSILFGRFELKPKDAPNKGEPSRTAGRKRRA